MTPDHLVDFDFGRGFRCSGEQGDFQSEGTGSAGWEHYDILG